MTFSEWVDSRLPLPRKMSSKEIAALVRDAYNAGYSQGMFIESQKPPYILKREPPAVEWPEYIEDKQ